MGRMLIRQALLRGDVEHHCTRQPGFVLVFRGQIGYRERPTHELLGAKVIRYDGLAGVFLRGL